MKAWLKALADKVVTPAKQATAKTVQVASDATEAATPHVKEAIKASTEIAAEGLDGQRYRVNAAVGTGRHPFRCVRSRRWRHIASAFNGNWWPMGSDWRCDPGC